MPKLAIRGQYGRDHDLGEMELYPARRKNQRYGDEFPEPLFLRQRGGMDVPEYGGTSCGRGTSRIHPCHDCAAAGLPY